MTPFLTQLAPAAPEILLLALTCIVLVLDLYIDDAHRAITYFLSLGTVLLTTVVLVMMPHDQPVYTFSNMYVDDTLGRTLKILVLLCVAFVFSYSRTYGAQREILKGEYFALVLFATLGMMVLISANHFLTLYLGLELLALAQYALVALQRDSARATEAAMKYFVLGALASGLLLYGMSMMYGATGALGLQQVAQALAGGAVDRTVASVGLVFIVAGLAFKLGVVPFHMWIPDVYEGAPTSMTLFVGTAPKIAGVAFFIRMLGEGLAPLAHDWQQMLVILAVLSIALGNITAIAQTNIKRMLAYSTISHMGFLMLGLLAASQQGYAAAAFYTGAYTLMGLGAFGMILLLSRAGFEAENLADFKGLNKRNPWFALMMLILMISMAGIPPSVGFFAKLAVLRAALDAGFTWLVVVAVLLSVIGAFYYLRVIKLMYMDSPVDEHPLEGDFDLRVLLSVNCLGVLLFGILPQPMIALFNHAVVQSLR
jgi:NADH-quinone oxidoreductase subunit N